MVGGKELADVCCFRRCLSLVALSCPELPLGAVSFLCCFACPAFFVATASAQALARQDSDNFAGGRAGANFIADEFRHHREA